MSYFDFPRLNFYGKCTLDAATANNGYYVPLVIYDPIMVKAVLPPRLYLSAETMKAGVTLTDIKKLLPPGVEIKEDTTTHLRGQSYVEILPINTPKIFGQWAEVPLGDFELDQAYIPLYKVLIATNTGSDLLGANPGYWNYYGSAKYAFGWKNLDGSFDLVKIKSVAISDGHKGEKLFYTGDLNIPGDIVPYLGATVTLNNVFQDPTTYTGVMTDLDPTFALYTQIFNDSFALFNEVGKTLMKGRPCKASLRYPNVFRIVNETMPNSGSGDFYSAIELKDLDEGMHAPIIQLFNKYGKSQRALKGIFIHQNLLEVQENRPPDYQKRGKTSNPAKLTIAGSISPWYEGEMRSLVMGRQLIQDQPFGQGSFLAPLILSNNESEKIINLQILNSVPHLNKDLKGGPPSPPTQTNPRYETYPLGTVSLVLEQPSKPDIQIGSIIINESCMPHDGYLQTGGVIRIPHALDQETLQMGTLAIYGQDDKGTSVRLLKENVYMINSDTCGLYANEGDDPTAGYVSYGYPKENCVLRIFEKGKPLTSLLPVSIQGNMITSGGGNQATTLLRNTYYRDQDIITFPADQPSNAMYLILPFHSTKPLSVAALQATIIATGSFISIRVLPRSDFSTYLSTDSTTQVEWPVLVREIFNTIIMIYPLMNEVLPFNQENWDNATMAAQMLNRISAENWSSFNYMPPSRDLSDDQKLLIYAWAKKFNLAPPDLNLINRSPVVTPGDVIPLDANSLANRFVK